MVKHYQPDCLVNSRIGKGMGDYGCAADNEIPDEDKLATLDKDNYHTEFIVDYVRIYQLAE